MANRYYNGPAGQISPFTRARAESVSDQLQAIAEGFDLVGDLVGPPGASNNTYSNLDEFLLAPASTRKATLSGINDVPDGEFYYEESRAPYVADGISTFAVFEVPLSTGAWVRQGADKVAYNPDTPDTISRTIGADLDDQFYPVTRFGVVGNGVTDDAVAVQKALNSDKPLDWLGLTIRIASAVSRTTSNPVLWRGRGATILYDGADAQAAVSITLSAGVRMEVENLTVDANKKASNALKVVSDATMASPSTFESWGLFVTGAKKFAAFTGVSAFGLDITGAFDVVELNGGGASNCEMPAGTGIPSNSGVSGINVALSSSDRWCRRLIVNGVSIEKIYSSDPAYQADQDGLGYFTPNDATHPSGKKEGSLVVRNSRFANCYGRSVKTQARETSVSDSTFVRSEGLASGVGNTEIDAQAGSLTVAGNKADYSNGFHPGVFARVSCDLVAGRSGLTVNDNEVYMDAATTLDTFAQSYASVGTASTVDVSNNRVFGKVKAPVDYAVNGTQNVATVRGNRFSAIVASGFTGDKALVYFRLAGASGDATAIIENNTYTGGDLPAVARDQVPLAGISASVSSANNAGFADDPTAAAKTSNLVTRQMSIVEAMTGAGNGAVKGGLRVITLVVSNGATVTLPVRRVQGGALLAAIAGVAGNGDNAICFSSTNSVNTKWFGNSAFVLGDTSEPVSGDFRIWSSASNELSVKNASGSQAPITFLIMDNG